MPDHEQPERMQATKPDSDIDELIRSSIATYGEPAPSSELAQRILLRIAAETPPVAPRRWLAWAVAVPIAACLIVFLVQSRPVHTPASLGNQAHIPAELHNDVASATSNPLQHENLKVPAQKEMRPRAVTIAARAQSLPKLDVFPTPEPLTAAEKALVDFAARAPALERKAFIEAQQQTDAPLTIAAIKIQPIELPELGTN